MHMRYSENMGEAKAAKRESASYINPTATSSTLSLNTKSINPSQALTILERALLSSGAAPSSSVRLGMALDDTERIWELQYHMEDLGDERRAR